MANKNILTYLLAIANLRPSILSLHSDWQEENVPLPGDKGQQNKVMLMSEETLKLAVSYSNANIVIERSVNIFHSVNEIRSSLDDMREAMKPCGIVMDDQLDSYDTALRNLEKLLQKIEGDARQEAIALRYKLKSQ